uniref:Caspase-1 n=1 Tax=Strigamia maritima TaxID=126957 RepID=T1J912_STRMM
MVFWGTPLGTQGWEIMASSSDVTDAKDLTGNETAVGAEDTSEPISASNDVAELDSKNIFQNWNPFNRKHITMPVGKYSSLYNMSHKSRGVALIFNHKDFNIRLHLNRRNGTDKDRDNFKRALEVLGFNESNIKIYDDYSANKIIDELKKVAEIDHSNNDCVLVAIFTHGDLNCLYANDKKIRPEDLWEPFTADKCPSLAGKPKLFFIQACQGDRLDAGVNVIDKGDNSHYYKIPTYADILIHYSTIPGFFSWRNTNEGSWFIQAVSAVFHSYGQQYDLLTLLTYVNQIVSTDFESNVPDNPVMDKKKQIPCLTSMLTRKVYFHPKRTS